MKKTVKAKKTVRRQPLRVKERVTIRVPTLVALRLQRAAEIAQLPQEQVVLALLSFALALVEASRGDFEVE